MTSPGDSALVKSPFPPFSSQSPGNCYWLNYAAGINWIQSHSKSKRKNRAKLLDDSKSRALLPSYKGELSYNKRMSTLCSGRVSILLKMPPSQHEDISTTESLDESDSFGELSLNYNSPLSVSEREGTYSSTEVNSSEDVISLASDESLSSEEDEIKIELSKDYIEFLKVTRRNREIMRMEKLKSAADLKNSDLFLKDPSGYGLSHSAPEEDLQVKALKSMQKLFGAEGFHLSTLETKLGCLYKQTVPP